MHTHMYEYVYTHIYKKIHTSIDRHTHMHTPVPTGSHLSGWSYKLLRPETAGNLPYPSARPPASHTHTHTHTHLATADSTHSLVSQSTATTAEPPLLSHSLSVVCSSGPVWLLAADLVPD